MFDDSPSPPSPRRVALYRGASYAGGELIRLLLGHPSVTLTAVTSRTYAGAPVWHAHPALRGLTDLVFVLESDVDPADADAVLIAGGHGESIPLVERLLDAGFAGPIVDLSADFRYPRSDLYPTWFGFDHPRPDLLDAFVYGLPEAVAPYPAETRLIANPGCFATGLSLALAPVARLRPDFSAAVTALTGASGSGARPKPTTHYPTRDGNVRAYKVFDHQHLPEVRRVVGKEAEIAFVPASGPWTRGIWGTAHIGGLTDVPDADVEEAFEAAYGAAPFVRLWPDALPELKPVVGSPFCDIGWKRDGRRLVVGFALDNLLKGAASQAIQNLNLTLHLPETAGLLPGPHAATFEEATP